MQIPPQLVQSDGAISVPYAGRIPAAGRSPAEVQQTIEARLAKRALQPQAIVVVVKSFVNTVSEIEAIDDRRNSARGRAGYGLTERAHDRIRLVAE